LALVHPAHVFDYDRLNDHTLNIRRSKKGEKITTLDGKEYTLPGNDIVADDGNGTIIDLLGIMGTANSVVVDTTKRIVLFLDNNNHNLLRKTSMNLGIRTEAAVLNEKGVNPDIMLPTLVTGIELLKKHANAKVISPIIDIYPNRIKSKTIKVTKDKIDSVIGIEIPQKTVVDILESLGFGVTVKENEFTVEIFTSRVNDIDIPEDIIEEVARVYGYHKIPNSLPALTEQANYHQDKNEFYWIQKVKEAFKFWGFTEVYTYSLVTEELFDGPIENALKLKNPLTEDKTYLRNSLVPSVIDVANQNKANNLQLFEIANVYLKKNKGLPDEVLHLAVVVRKEKASFFDGKGIVESVAKILGITTISFEKKKDGIEGADIMLSGKNIGSIEADEDITVEINVQELLKHANSKKIYKEPAKFPPLIEDVRVEVPAHYPFAKIEKALKESSELVHSISLLDVYKNKKTFRIVYLSRTRSLTTGDIQPIRKGIEDILTTQFKATLG
jgi:phenylalanyl-tRNA synthetase beta chain